MIKLKRAEKPRANPKFEFGRTRLPFDTESAKRTVNERFIRELYSRTISRVCFKKFLLAPGFLDIQKDIQKDIQRDPSRDTKKVRLERLPEQP